MEFTNGTRTTHEFTSGDLYIRKKQCSIVSMFIIQYKVRQYFNCIKLFVSMRSV